MSVMSLSLLLIQKHYVRPTILNDVVNFDGPTAAFRHQTPQLTMRSVHTIYSHEACKRLSCVTVALRLTLLHTRVGAMRSYISLVVNCAELSSIAFTASLFDCFFSSSCCSLLRPG